jgi:hypothetical protein
MSSSQVCPCRVVPVRRYIPNYTWKLLERDTMHRAPLKTGYGFPELVLLVN